MTVKVTWDTEPVFGKSLARTGEIGIGNKKLRFPLRATSVGKTTSEFEEVRGATGTSPPTKTVTTYYTRLNKTSIDILTTTNGRFTARKREANEALSRVSENAVRIVYARIPKTEKNAAGKHVVLVNKLTMDEAKAIFDFLNGIANNDVLLFPVPPSIETAEDMVPILNAWKERIETFGTRKEMMAYVPSVSNPILARKILEKYLGSGLDFNMFAVDFANGHAERTVMETISTLFNHKKAKQIGDFYVHGLNSRHFYNTDNISAAIEDMFSHIMGFDSFNNVQYAAGGDNPTSETPQEIVFQDYNRKIRYWYEGDYGGHQFDEAIPRAKKQECRCPVCANHDINEIYTEFGHDLAYKLLRSHHVFSELVGEKKQTECIKAGTLDRYLYQKDIPNRSGLASLVQKNIRTVT
jgi:hypothetical protein